MSRSAKKTPAHYKCGYDKVNIKKSKKGSRKAAKSEIFNILKIENLSNNKFDALDLQDKVNSHTDIHEHNNNRYSDYSFDTSYSKESCIDIYNRVYDRKCYFANLEKMKNGEVAEVFGIGDAVIDPYSGNRLTKELKNKKFNKSEFHKSFSLNDHWYGGTDITEKDLTKMKENCIAFYFPIFGIIKGGGMTTSRWSKRLYDSVPSINIYSFKYFMTFFDKGLQDKQKKLLFKK